jgi:hypothetical protein
VAFGDANNGWAVGSGGSIRRTEDGGVTWGAQSNSGITTRLNAVTTNRDNRVLAVGNNGAVQRRNSITTTGAFGSATNGTIGTTQLNGVSLPSGNTGYVVGNGGFIAKCGNSNNNDWTQQTSGTTRNLLSVHFIDVNTGYVTGDSGLVLKTCCPWKKPWGICPGCNCARPGWEGS